MACKLCCRWALIWWTWPLTAWLHCRMTSQRHFLSSHPTWRSTSGKSRCFYIICYSMQSGYASMVPIPSRRWCWRHYVFRLSIRCMYEHLCVCVWAEAFPIYLLFTSSFTYIHIYSADVTWELHNKKYCYVYQGNYKCDSWEVLYYKNVLYKQSTHTRMHAHRHTHAYLMALCPGLPTWASTRKLKPIWILWSKRQWVAVASAAGQYASLHLASDR